MVSILIKIVQQVGSNKIRMKRNPSVDINPVEKQCVVSVIEGNFGCTINNDPLEVYISTNTENKILLRIFKNGDMVEVNTKSGVVKKITR